MNKKDLFDAFDGFSTNLMENLAEIDAIKKHVQELISENTALRLENNKLRERLSHLEEAKPAKTSSQGRKYLTEIYDDGFHICNDFYGQRRDSNGDCMICTELLYRN